MKKILLLAVFMALVVLPATCLARPLPDSEFCLGGLSVFASSLDDAIKIYGEPTFIGGDKFARRYRYGDSVTLLTSVFDDREKIKKITVSANNGWATPSGLTVGMTTSALYGIYGYEHPRNNNTTGYMMYIYPHRGSGAGASMRVEVDSKDVVRQITVTN